MWVVGSGFGGLAEVMVVLVLVLVLVWGNGGIL